MSLIDIIVIIIIILISIIICVNIFIGLKKDPCHTCSVRCKKKIRQKMKKVFKRR